MTDDFETRLIKAETKLEEIPKIRDNFHKLSNNVHTENIKLRTDINEVKQLALISLEKHDSQEKVIENNTKVLTEINQTLIQFKEVFGEKYHELDKAVGKINLKILFATMLSMGLITGVAWAIENGILKVFE